jgi:hypothetical protein
VATNDQATTSRNKASPQQISNQAARAVKAHAAVERACLARLVEVHRAERQVSAAVHVAARETARLAAICSVETTAGILGLEPDEVRRLIRRTQRPEQRRGPDRRPRG